MLLVDEAMQTGVPAEPVTPGSYGGSLSPREETAALTAAAESSQDLTLDEAAAAADQIYAAETEPGVVQVPGMDPAEAASSTQAPQQTETKGSDDQTSAADHVDAPLTESGSGGLLSSNDIIPVVDEGSIELDAAGTKEAAADSRRAQLVQQGSTSQGGEGGSFTASPKGTAGWSGGQMAGLIVGVIAAGCIAAVAVVCLKRRRRPAQANYSAFAHDIEMRGLI